VERHFLLRIGQLAHDELHVRQDMLASLGPIGCLVDWMVLAVLVAPDQEFALVGVERWIGEHRTAENAENAEREAEESRQRKRRGARNRRASFVWPDRGM